MTSADIKQHVSIEERTKWDKVVDDFAVHLGNYGDDHHKRGDGTNPGFSTNDYTNAEKDKLSSVEYGANKYIHPATHNVSEIEGLANVAITGSYNSLIDIPDLVLQSVFNKQLNGIRFTVGTTSPDTPVNNKDVWFDTNDRLVKVYTGSAWVSFRAVYG
jgi:hypothetical protein